MIMSGVNVVRNEQRTSGLPGDLDIGLARASIDAALASHRERQVGVESERKKEAWRRRVEGGGGGEGQRQARMPINHGHALLIYGAPPLNSALPSVPKRGTKGPV